MGFLRSKKLSKNQKFTFRLCIEKLEFDSRPNPLFEYRVFWKRGNKRNGTSEWTNEEIDFSLKGEFEVKCTMFEKKSGFKRKMMYLVLQTRHKGKESVSNLEKAEINLAKQCEAGIHPLNVTFEKTKIKLVGNICAQARDPNDVVTMTDDLTTFGLNTDMDDGEDTELDEISDNENVPAIVKTKGMKHSMMRIENEIEKLGKQAAQTKKLEEIKGSTETGEHPLEFLAKELKTELLTLREDFELTQKELRKQLAEERERSMNIKRDLETQLRNREFAIQKLQIELRQAQLLNSENESQKSQSKSLSNKIEENQNALISYKSQLEEQEKKLKTTEEEQLKIIHELQDTVRRYELKESYKDDYSHQSEFFKKELEQYQEKERENKLREEEFRKEMEELQSKLKSVEKEKLTLELKQEEKLSTLQSSLFEKEKNTMDLQVKLDQKEEREKQLKESILQMEKELLNSSKEFQSRECELKERLEAMQLELQLTQKSKLSGIVREGWLTKQGKRWKTWRKRYFILNSNGTLSYGKTPSVAPIRVLNLKQVTGCVLENWKKPNVIKLNLPSHEFYVQAISTEDVMEWKSAFKEAGCNMTGN